MSAEEYHLIEKYLNNDLTDAEQKVFESKMHDPDFAETVRVYTEVSESLKAREKGAAGEKELTHTLKTVSSEYFAGAKKKGKLIPLRNIYWMAAACIVIALSFVFIINWQTGQPTYSDYADYEPLALSSRSEEQTLTVSAEEAFNNGNFEEAATHLKQLLETDPDNPKLKIYLALSYIETENYAQAHPLLLDVEQGKSIFRSTASWYLALSYLKQGDRKASEKQLLKIPEDSPFFGKARKLLGEM